MRGAGAASAASLRRVRAFHKQAVHGAKKDSAYMALLAERLPADAPSVVPFACAMAPFGSHHSRAQNPCVSAAVKGLQARHMEESIADICIQAFQVDAHCTVQPALLPK